MRTKENFGCVGMSNAIQHSTVNEGRLCQAERKTREPSFFLIAQGEKEHFIAQLRSNGIKILINFKNIFS